MTFWQFSAAWVLVILVAVLSEWWHEVRQARALADNNRRWELLFGTPGKVEIASRDVDAHERLERQVSEDTIAAGMRQLAEGYRAAGMTVTDDELRAEVITIASGLSPLP